MECDSSILTLEVRRAERNRHSRPFMSEKFVALTTCQIVTDGAVKTVQKPIISAKDENGTVQEVLADLYTLDARTSEEVMLKNVVLTASILAAAEMPGQDWSQRQEELLENIGKDLLKRKISKR